MGEGRRGRLQWRSGAGRGVEEVGGSTLRDTQSAATGFEPALNLSDLEIFFLFYLYAFATEGRLFLPTQHVVCERHSSAIRYGSGGQPLIQECPPFCAVTLGVEVEHGRVSGAASVGRGALTLPRPPLILPASVSVSLSCSSNEISSVCRNMQFFLSSCRIFFPLK